MAFSSVAEDQTWVHVSEAAGKMGKRAKKRERKERDRHRERAREDTFIKKYKSMQLRKRRNDSLGGNDGGEG